MALLLVICSRWDIRGRMPWSSPKVVPLFPLNFGRVWKGVSTQYGRSLQGRFPILLLVGVWQTRLQIWGDKSMETLAKFGIKCGPLLPTIVASMERRWLYLRQASHGPSSKPLITPTNFDYWIQKMESITLKTYCSNRESWKRQDCSVDEGLSYDSHGNCSRFSTSNPAAREIFK